MSKTTFVELYETCEHHWDPPTKQESTQWVPMGVFNVSFPAFVVRLWCRIFFYFPISQNIKLKGNIFIKL